MTTPRTLSRASGDGRPPAPVRIVHLGLGNFFRAHQAWYTEHAPDAAEWGIAAFGGNRSVLSDSLAAQDGLYTLLVRDAEQDRPEVVASLSAVHGGGDLDALRAYLSSPAVCIVTTTVTEAGYLRTDTGALDVADPLVVADLAALRSDPMGALVRTAPGKLVAGLVARRVADAGPITLLPCDNVPDNGPMLARVVRELAELVDPALPAWIDANVSVATTMVDRITPRSTPQDERSLADRTGIDDPCLVVTEPFTEWVIAGQFPAGRPQWEAVGVRFVEDIVPFETRKLWLLNGSHSLMAYAASIAGHETVYDAVADPVVRGWVQQWWDDAARQLDFPPAEVAAYRAALLQRFANPGIRHLLAQIAADGSQKLPIRIVPTLLAERAVGRMPAGATRAVAAWVAHLRGHGAPVTDAKADEVMRLIAGADADDEAVEAVLGWLGIHDSAVTDVVLEQYREMVGSGR
ncbi:MAG: mannitol dehydrogenase family protein [Dermatophilaceae bacterium]